MTMAVEYEQEFSGVVALSGYYYQSLRLDVFLPSLGLVPGIGTILHASISLFMSLWLIPLTKRMLFWPLPIPRRFVRNFSVAMATRSVQTRASAEDAALMLPSVIGLRTRYRRLKLPIAVVAGKSDLIISENQAKRLNANLPNGTLDLAPNVGHMVHYAATNKVVEIVEKIMGKVSGG